MAKSRSSPSVRWKRTWLALALLVPVLLFWVGQTVRTLEISYRIEKIEEQIRLESARGRELEMARDHLISLASVETIARNKLGLVLPADKNVIWMSLPNR